MSFVIAHPTGNANVRQAVLALYDAGILGTYITSLDPTRLLHSHLLPGSVKRVLQRRSLPEGVSQHTVWRPSKEIRRNLGRRVSHFSVSDHDFYEHFGTLAAKRLRPGDSAYAYEDAALPVLQAAQRFGSESFYELPMGFHSSATEILERESASNLAWASTMPGLLAGPAVADRKNQELEFANHILVPSTFAASTIPSESLAKVHVVPYGCPPARAEPFGGTTRGPLKVLFVGGLTQRKGLSYLFDGIRLADIQADVTVVGRQYAKCNVLERALENTAYFSSLPHDRILQLMHESDVLVFPTLFDGYGLVIAEALSQGCPVIASRNSAGPDLIEEGVNGFLVDAGSAAAVAEHLTRLNEDRQLVEHMKEQALARVRPWSSYRNTLVDLVAMLSHGGH